MTHFYSRAQLPSSPSAAAASHLGCTCKHRKDGKECAACRARRLRQGSLGERSPLNPKGALRRGAQSVAAHRSSMPTLYHSMDGMTLGTSLGRLGRRTPGAGPSMGRPREIATPPSVRYKKILGFNINTAHCSCIKRLHSEMRSAKLMSKLYTKCGKDPKNKTGTAIEICHDKELKKLGVKAQTAGSTSSSGKVQINKSPGACGPIVDHATKIHEDVHATTTKSLQKLHGKNTPAFDAAWNDAKNWVADEVKAYRAEIPFYRAAIAHLKSICKKKRKGSGGHTGALVGGSVGGLAGILGGSLLANPFSAALGGLLGATAGAGLGSLFD